MSDSPYAVDKVSSLPSPDKKPSNRTEVYAWAMYDWASSAFSTLQITIVFSYITGFVFSSKDAFLPGESIYGYVIGISMFLAALSSPIIGAMADARANKRTWLAFSTVLGSGCGTLMAFVPTQASWLIGLLFFLTCLGFELSWGIYNGFLPEIADENSMNRVSALGFGMGYLGGGLALLLAILVLKFGESFGLPKIEDNAEPHLRIGIAIMGIWWAVFSIPSLLVLRDKGTVRGEPLALIPQTKAAFRQVFQTLRKVRRYAPLALFLLGFLFYNDGMQAVITQASSFAKLELKMDAFELSMMILMVQFVSLPGALLVGILSDWIGAKITLHINLAVWVALLIAAFFITTKGQFWVMAAVLALVMGGAQSVSRAMMAMMTPASSAAEFMGFFNLSGRAVSFLGPILFATILLFTGSSHYAILSLLIFIVAGWLLICFVNLDQGKRQAAEESLP